MRGDEETRQVQLTSSVSLDEAGKSLLHIVEVNENVVDEVDSDVVAIG